MSEAGASPQRAPDAPAPAPDERALDPVCGMRVARDGPLQWTHAGTLYYFCNPRCLARFQASPEQYLTPAARSPDPNAAADTREYICPMDPEMRQIGPGACPICGMSLEPRAKNGAPPHTTTGVARAACAHGVHA